MTLVLGLNGAKGTTTLTSPGVPGECSYDRTPEGLTADCTGRGLTEVPNDLPENLVVLELKVNKIKILTNNSFSSVPILRYLSLHHNHLIYIQRGTFDSLSVLEYIDLSHNTNLPSGLPTGIFSKNPNLQVINLKGNNFTSIPIKPLALFQNVNETTIRFADNPIRHLNFSGFPLIHVFRLDLQSLSLSDLSFNDFLPLKRIPISILELNRNNLKVLSDGVFQYLRLVSKLYLSYNSIRNLTLNAFVGMESLTELYLRSCGIRVISGFSENITNVETGFRIPPLKSLTLSYNHFSILPVEVFLGLNQLTFLNLRAANIAHLSNASFKGLDSLQNLDLSLNKLYAVNAELFSHLPNLQTLLLSTNKIQVLSPNKLSGLNSLKYFDLSDNSMREFEEGVWDLPSLDTLDLSNINIELLKTVSFKGLTSLRKLILSSNPIQNLGYDTFRKSMTTLKILTYHGLVNCLIFLNLSYLPIV